MKIISFATSNSSQSISRDLAIYSASLVKEAKNIDLRDFDTPIYSPDLEKELGIPDSIKKLHQEIEKSDAIIICLNEHNGYPPAFFKNILDWLTREKHQFLAEKSLILMSSSPGKMGAQSSLKAMETTLPIFGAKIIASISIGSFFEVFKDGKLIDETLNYKLNDALRQLEE